MHVEKICKDICHWLREEVTGSGGKGCVFGLSGGLDSAVVAVLCQKTFASQCLALVMPCHSLPEDQEDALSLAEKFQIPTRVVVLDPVYDQFISVLGAVESTENTLARANIKPRLRMCTLYYYAATLHYRVIGTGNKSEIMIGYFTKHGDGGVDLEPLGDLLKEDVYALARYLEIPEQIIGKEPSGGLWEGQSDEVEMGFTYTVLDHYLKGGTVDGATGKKIGLMEQQSRHKRKLPPVFTVKQ
jgi:NAD+ synthase